MERKTMKTTITINTIAANCNLDKSGILENLQMFGIENLPEGLKRATLLDIYRAAVRDGVNTAIAADTTAGNVLAKIIADAIAGLPTIEAAHLVSEKLFEMFEEYSSTRGDASLDTIAPEKQADFIAAVENAVEIAAAI